MSAEANEWGLDEIHVEDDLYYLPEPQRPGVLARWGAWVLLAGAAVVFAVMGLAATCSRGGDRSVRLRSTPRSADAASQARPAAGRRP